MSCILCTCSDMSCILCTCSDIYCILCTCSDMSCILCTCSDMSCILYTCSDMYCILCTCSECPVYCAHAQNVLFVVLVLVIRHVLYIVHMLRHVLCILCTCSECPVCCVRAQTCPGGARRCAWIGVLPDMCPRPSSDRRLSSLPSLPKRMSWTRQQDNTN